MANAIDHTELHRLKTIAVMNSEQASLSIRHLLEMRKLTAINMGDMYDEYMGEKGKEMIEYLDNEIKNALALR